jgi:hypothetical protein
LCTKSLPAYHQLVAKPHDEDTDLKHPESEQSVQSLSIFDLAMANNPLSTESILKHMADALPTHAKGDASSDFSSSYEAIALFAHACMTAVGFRLIGYSEGQKTGTSSTSTFNL